MSGPNVAFNGFGMTASVSGATFDFIGAYLTGAWNDDLSVTVVAYNRNVLVDQQTVVVDSDALTWFEFDFVGITDLVFSSSGGTNAGYGYFGPHFALDDFTFSMSANQAPVISTDNLQLSESNGMTTVRGLSVSDPDATSNENFTVTAVSEAGGSSVTIPSNSGTLNDINNALDTGVTYDPGSPEPETDMVTFSVADGHGGSDTVNFIFNQAGTGPVALQGTVLKDVIFATGYSDTLTGGASADQFVFAANSGHDTITDFTPGQDRIDLFNYLPFDPGSTASFNAWITNDNAVEQLASGTLIHLDLDTGDSILLSNVSRASLQMNDFILHPGGVVVGD
ncbi:MAG: hypothetical protein FD165_2835 [Gammaproteobacteria bacterium]|nr:MAG: hypothetical protein FD165_2835 [Gammaproteobacteria bacterium]